MKRKVATSGWLGAASGLTLAIFFLIPFAIMLAVSVAHRDPGGFFGPGFDLSSYRRFLTPFFANILMTSVAVAAGAAVICVTLAVPFVVFLASMGRAAQTVILVILLSVLSLSEVIIGFSLSTLLSQTAGVGNILAWLGVIEAPQAYTPSLFALMTGLCYLAFPYTVLVLYPAVSRLDPELPEAARTMGASPVRTFFTVTVPTLRAAIFGTLILVFVFTLGAYLLPQVLGRPQHWTLSVHITDQAIFQANVPFAAAMAVFLLVVALAMVGLVLLIGREREARP